MESRSKYINQWKRENSYRVALDLPIDMKPIVKEHAAAMGESVNAFVKRAIEETIENDSQKDIRTE